MPKNQNIPKYLCFVCWYDATLIESLILDPFIVVQGGPCGLQNNISYCYWFVCPPELEGIKLYC